MNWERAFVYTLLAAVAVVLLSGWVLERQPRPYVNVQTCIYSPEELGGKLGNLCSRLDPGTHWSLRQRI
jgi:hypothetical protein